MKFTIRLLNAPPEAESWDANFYDVTIGDWVSTGWTPIGKTITLRPGTLEGSLQVEVASPYAAGPIMTFVFQSGAGYEYDWSTPQVAKTKSPTPWGWIIAGSAVLGVVLAKGLKKGASR